MKGSHPAHLPARETLTGGELLVLTLIVVVTTVAMFLGLRDLFQGFLTLVSWVNQQ